MDLIKQQFGVFLKQRSQWGELTENSGGILRSLIKVGWVWVCGHNGRILAGPYVAESGLKRGKARAERVSFNARLSAMSLEKKLEFLQNYEVSSVRFSSGTYMYVTLKYFGDDPICFQHYRAWSGVAYTTYLFEPGVKFKKLDNDVIEFTNGSSFKTEPEGYGTLRYMPR